MSVLRNLTLKPMKGPNLTNAERTNNDRVILTFTNQKIGPPIEHLNCLSYNSLYHLTYWPIELGHIQTIEIEQPPCTYRSICERLLDD